MNFYVIWKLELSIILHHMILFYALSLRTSTFHGPPHGQCFNHRWSQPFAAYPAVACRLLNTTDCPFIETLVVGIVIPWHLKIMQKDFYSILLSFNLSTLIKQSLFYFWFSLPCTPFNWKWPFSQIHIFDTIHRPRGARPYYRWYS